MREKDRSESERERGRGERNNKRKKGLSSESGGSYPFFSDIDRPMY